MSARMSVGRTDNRGRLEALALAACRRMNAVLEKASRDWSSPMEALRRAVGACAAYTSRFPGRFRLMLDEPVAGSRQADLAIEMRRTLSTLAALVRAAQQAGELGAGDPDAIAALIVGATIGQADLERAGVSAGAGASPLLLLDLLDRKQAGADPEDADAADRMDLERFRELSGPRQ